MSTENYDYRKLPPDVNADLDEQVRASGQRPIESLDDLKGPEGLWESKEEVEEFIEFIYAQRRASQA